MVVVQLGVPATYTGDNLQALCYCLFSLDVPVPFTTARANAELLLEKVLTFCAILRHTSLTFFISINNGCLLFRSWSGASRVIQT